MKEQKDRCLHRITGEKLSGERRKMGRDLTKCHPHLQKLAKELVVACEKQGCPIGIGECLRTVQEQNRLYAQVRTKPGPVVTNAPGSTYRSMHQWGVAFDVYRKDGKGAYNESGNYFQRVGAIGKLLGLEWGGDWKSIVDKPHFQLPDWGSTSERLRKQYGNIYAFQATWPDSGTSTENSTSSEKEKPYIEVKALTADSTQKEWILALQIELIRQGYQPGDIDGITGSRTLSGCPTVRKGAKGELTRWIQKRLSLYLNVWSEGGQADGIFGEKTEQNIRNLQKSKGLTVDGIVGKKTWDALLQSR